MVDVLLEAATWLDCGRRARSIVVQYAIAMLYRASILCRIVVSTVRQQSPGFVEVGKDSATVVS